MNAKVVENGCGCLGKYYSSGAPSQQINSLLKELGANGITKTEQCARLLFWLAVVHNQFEVVHPFQDGNGRVGRLLLNNILLKHDLPPLNIELKNRALYYAALH